eukprot:CAMPEP_0181401858 /NCGR_PEP_ID=MMETSP1110-20121109/2870_1 /TAXON_ID=174948 /ORGANISM="Symbiodinium sp., Strain CCMP421" /LENGTH=51 /DNA_ID=CAMNT_0023524047 /DNA_START=85 /DNA_END=237 /DNA_ORIENTATION=-
MTSECFARPPVQPGHGGHRNLQTKQLKDSTTDYCVTRVFGHGLTVAGLLFQ